MSTLGVSAIFKLRHDQLITPFDTHRFYKILGEAEFEEKQAEALTDAQIEIMSENLVTKFDIDGLETKIETQIGRLETRMQAQSRELALAIKNSQEETMAAIKSAKVETVIWTSGLLAAMTAIFAAVSTFTS